MRRFVAPLVASIFVQAALAAVAHAGVATSIHADGSLGTKVTANGKTVTIDGGALTGSNLFESFSDFSLAAGSTALWTWSGSNSSAITNVINRVTGGGVSQIDGTLDSSRLPHAAFWFINPAGIVFGSGASVNVPAAAYFATAQQLRFGDGKVFTATTPTGSTLSMGAPSAFGFLGGEGDINISGVGAANPAGGAPSTMFGPSLFLAAANLAISDTFIQTGKLDLIAVGAQVRQVSVANPLAGQTLQGDVSLANSLVATLPSPSADGSIEVGGAAVTVKGGKADGVQTLAGPASPAGSMELTTGVFTLEGGGPADGPSVGSFTMTSQDAGDVTISTGDLIMEAGGLLQSDTYGGGNAGTVLVEAAGTVSIDMAAITTDTRPGSKGLGGAIEVVADTLNIQNRGGIVANTLAPGKGGNVKVRARAINIQGGADIAAVTLGDASDTGSAGNVVVVADTIVIQNGGSIRTDALDPNSKGQAGYVALHAGALTVETAGYISSDTYGLGRAGNVAITTGEISVNTGGLVETNTYRPDSQGNAGNISISTGDLTMEAGGLLQSDTYGGGNAGTVLVEAAGTVSIDMAAITTDTRPGSKGLGGAIEVVADTLNIQNRGGIVANTLAPGKGGNVKVRARAINIQGGADIAAVTLGDASDTGSAGNVVVVADTIVIQNGGSIRTDALDPNSKGQAGYVALDVGSMLIDGIGSRVSSANPARKGGPAGAITIVTGPITLSNGGSISTNAASGVAGDVSLTVENGARLILEGAQYPGAITTTSGTNTGGKIDISGPSAIILNGGEIQALGPANLASATIQAGVVIESSDRPNNVAVQGTLVLDSKIVDVSQAVTVGSVAFEDASKVLRGQCPALRARGETSQLGATLDGPYGPTPMGASAQSLAPTRQRLASGCDGAFGSP